MPDTWRKIISDNVKIMGNADPIFANDPDNTLLKIQQFPTQRTIMW